MQAFFLTAHNSLNSYAMTKYKGYSFEATPFARRKEKAIRFCDEGARR